MVTESGRRRTFWLRVAFGVFVLLNGFVFARRGAIQIRALVRPGYEDRVAPTDQAFARVARFLPPDGTIGYTKAGLNFKIVDDIAGLYLAEYALAPRNVVAGTAPDVVIAVSRDGTTFPDMPPGFVRTHEEAGVAVFRRER